MRGLKAASIVIIAAVSLLLVVLVACISQAYVARWRAEHCLAMLERIQVGVTKRDALLEMFRPFRGNMSEEPDADQRSLGLNFDNHGLVSLRVAPYTEFRVSITFKDDVVVEKQAREFQARLGCGARVDEKIRGFGSRSGTAPNDYPNHIVRSAPPGFPGPVRHVSVEDDNTLGESQRRTDWRFNLSCMTQLNGCNDARRMLPDARPSN